MTRLSVAAFVAGSLALVPFLSLLAGPAAIIMTILVWNRSTERGSHAAPLALAGGIFGLLGLAATGIIILVALAGPPVPAARGLQAGGGAAPSLAFRAVEFAALIVAVIIHECAHGIVSLWCGDPTAWREGRISLNPMRHIDPIGSIVFPLILLISGTGIIFGWAKPVRVRPDLTQNPRRSHILLSAAGPLSNYILALACFSLLAVSGGALTLMGLGGHVAGFSSLTGAVRITGLPGAYLLALVLQVLKMGMLINIVLGTLNLIPIPPLDGSWIIEKVLPPSIGNRIARLRPYGFFILFGMLAFGLIEYLLLPALIVVLMMQGFLMYAVRLA